MADDLVDVLAGPLLAGDSPTDDRGESTVARSAYVLDYVAGTSITVDVDGQALVSTTADQLVWRLPSYTPVVGDAVLAIRYRGRYALLGKLVSP